LRDYFQSGSTTADSVEWPIEQVPDSSPLESYDYNNQAGAVNSDIAEAKPESEFQFDLETRTVRDIAHLARLHKNLMNDLPLLQTYLPQRLRDGLNREVSRQILRGEDSNQEIIGLNQTGSHVEFDVSSFQAAVVNNNKTVADANFIDILAYANTQLRLGNYQLTGYLINPADYYSLAFVVNDDGDYLMNTPNWRMIADRVIQSNYVTAGKFYAFDRRANMILSRQNVNVEFSYEDRDNFQKNLVTIRAEERAVQVTDRPNGIVYGDFADAVAS
jgi:HK97 family phage major capsid protein